MLCTAFALASSPPPPSLSPSLSLLPMNPKRGQQGNSHYTISGCTGQYSTLLWDTVSSFWPHWVRTHSHAQKPKAYRTGQVEERLGVTIGSKKLGVRTPAEFQQRLFICQYSQRNTPQQEIERTGMNASIKFGRVVKEAHIEKNCTDMSEQHCAWVHHVSRQTVHHASMHTPCIAT